ncbi:hypothetical protein ACVRZG_08720 [Streptococcus hyovaginalis]|uniref:hypothetical protein n=1 Tax=Streptococcus hyovaginalis TaxID=149015 RepID=UPI000404282B|nr:hypothetical protein [Streptococcus hyovaginalis]
MSEKFLDRRPEDTIEFFDSFDVEYFELEITDKNFINSKAQKDKVAIEIVDKKKDLEIKDSEVSVRYSSNYADEEMKTKKPRSYVSDRGWQSWHSIDLQLKDIDTKSKKITIDNLKLSEAILYYAFITPYQKKFQVLLFSKENLERLIQKKIKKSSYSIYKNSQNKQYAKFNFYFTTSVEGGEDSGVKDKNNVTIFLNDKMPFLQRMIVKIKNIFN